MGTITGEGPGLTVDRYFASVADQDLRVLLDPAVLVLLDAIFGGQLEGDQLRRVARTLVDVSSLLEVGSRRELLLKFLSCHKRLELEERVGKAIDQSANWTRQEVQHALDFFGLFEERLVPPAVRAVSDVVPAYGLFDHQRSAVQRLQPLLADDDRRAILHLPTGVGKTRTAMHVVADVLRQHEPSIVVWLASGKELLDQAVSSFGEAWSALGNRPLRVASMWGSSTPDLGNFVDGFMGVGLAKAWSAMSGSDPDWAARLAERVRLVVFDEAHQSIATTYRRITDELMLDYRCSLLGLTATPGRTWNDIDEDGKLADYYSGNKVTLEVPSESPIDYLIENGFLARPIFRTLFSDRGIDLSQSELARIARALDIDDEILQRLSLSEQYVSAVLRGIDELLNKGHARILVFAASVRHAHILTAILAARGTKSAAITNSTPERIRNRAVRDFKDAGGGAFVLNNFGVLTTGFDAPRASAVVIARPTRSLVLYSQMIGRVIRGPKAGGTDACEIVTVVDPHLPGFGSVADAFLNWEDSWS